MLAAIGQFLPNAFGIALSPMPLILLLVLMFTRHARANAVAVLVGWWVGVGVLAGLVLLLGLRPSESGPTAATGWINLVMAALFAFLTFTSWRGRPRPGEPIPVPRWLARTSEMKPLAAFGLSAAVIGVNAKNSALIITGALWISAAELPALRQAVLLAVFAVLSSLIALAIVAMFLALGDKVAPMLTTMKQWLERNNAYVMTFLFAYLGITALGKALNIFGS